MAQRTTAEVMDRFNHAFVSHDPAALEALGYSKTGSEIPLAAEPPSGD